MSRYVCHCTVNVFDGVSTLTSRPTVVIEAADQSEAVTKAQKQIRAEYEERGCSVNSISFALINKVT